MNPAHLAPSPRPKRTFPWNRAILLLPLAVVLALAGTNPALAVWAVGDAEDPSPSGQTAPGTDLLSASSAPGRPLSAGSLASSSSLPFRSIAYTASSQPRTVTAADLNADGFPDLVVPHNNSRTTLILYGNPDGIYNELAPSARTLVDAEFNGQKAVAADFNSDGHLDLAIVHYFDGVFVWYQNADGSFGTGGVWNARLTVAGNFKRCLAAGDLNGDAVPDLAIVSETAAVTLWLAPGAAGSWASAGSFGTAANVSDWIEFADFNEDGLLDIVVSADDPSNVVSVMLGTGHVSPYFGSPTTYPVGQGPNTCTTADMNGDGHIDIVGQSWFFAPVGGSVSVLLGHGNGAFDAAIISSFVSLRQDDSFAIAAAELTGDGLMDVVVANGLSGTVAVIPGLGNGTFGTPRLLGCGSAARGIALTDVNLDGRLDIAVSNLGSNTVQVLTSISHGEYDGAVYATGTETPSTFNIEDRFIASLASGDLNGDGIVDLATNHPTPGTVSVILGGAGGSFGAPADIPVGPNPFAVAMADLDRDGFQDVAVANKANGTVSLLPGKGDGTFKAKVSYGVGKSPVDVVAGDVNADGRLDVLTANFEDNTISVLIKNPGAGFKSRVNYDVGAGPTGIAVGDVSGDGLADVVVADSISGGFTVLTQTNNGKLVFSAFYSTGGGPCYVTVADFDQNGYNDVAVSNTRLNRVEFWRNLGAGLFFANAFSTFSIPRRISSGDLDGDGWPEAFVAARSGQTFVLYPFTPNLPHGSSRRWAFGAVGGAVVMADANVDGSPDLITLHTRSQSVSVLLNASGAGALLAGPRQENDSRAVGRVSVSPNPLNPIATMRFSLSEAGPLRVRLFNVQGRLVRTLVDEKFVQPGEKVLTLDGRGDRGHALTSGIYFYRVEGAKSVQEGRVTILK